MRDDGHKWDAPSADPDVILGPDLQARQIWPERQTLISGVDVLKDSDLPLVEWPGSAPVSGFALVLRRDRILEVGGPARADGWDESRRWAISDMSDGYAVLHLDGPGALDLLKRGGVVSPDAPSRSVARPLFYVPALLYRRAAPDGFAIHVGRGLMQALRKSVVETLRSMSPRGAL